MHKNEWKKVLIVQALKKFDAQILSTRSLNSYFFGLESICNSIRKTNRIFARSHSSYADTKMKMSSSNRKLVSFSCMQLRLELRVKIISPIKYEHVATHAVSIISKCLTIKPSIFSSLVFFFFLVGKDHLWRTPYNIYHHLEIGSKVCE